jgi:hypothetical protein
MRRRCRKSLSARSADFHPRHIIHPRIAVPTDTPIMTVASITAGFSALTCAATVNPFPPSSERILGFYCTKCRNIAITLMVGMPQRVLITWG